jgi:hypothetical protein
MLSYITVVGPLIRSLWSLEASNANASDVFIFWLAIAGTLKHLFDQPMSITGIKPQLARKVTDIFNNRYKEFFHTDLYFVTFCLDPRKPFTFTPTTSTNYYIWPVRLSSQRLS